MEKREQIQTNDPGPRAAFGIHTSCPFGAGIPTRRAAAWGSAWARAAALGRQDPADMIWGGGWR